MPTSNKCTAASPLSSLLTWYSALTLLPNQSDFTSSATSFATSYAAANLAEYAWSCKRASLTM